MSELILWKDQEMRKLRRDMDRLFSRCWSDLGVDLFLEECSGAPSIDMTETEDALIVRATLKGVKPENLDITLSGDTLIISGKRSEESVDDTGFYPRVERRLSSFQRTLSLPCKVEVDDIEASFKEDHLKIILPKLKSKPVHGIRVKIR
jgi:HSP20 family protein